ncbi:hypothetical protein [uncultured Bacteroides sp.]|uniref:hypothetical protein n=1 Tax=uncultured Bacteroides sp. TaxID=162156 RepID=UPI002AA8FB25|nr:hypothetical protein [uncultured Bacteroides sp.]
MKKNRFWVAVALTTCFVCGLGLTSCSNEADGSANVSTRSTEELADVISTDKTLYADVTYVLTGKTYVASGATLTINAGTRIEGVYNANPDEASALVVTKGGKIMANGTAAAPIIMTAQNGTKGGWGGLVLLGRATVNQGNNGVIEGIDPDNTTIPAGIEVTYGGNVDNDNSGVLSYVRVEYAGASISLDNELNAFTFGGVGSGTIVDHCQAYHGADDAFEFFGGTVNCKYLVATANDDDSFDFDFGYRGMIQFGVATIDPSLSYSSNPNGIECDNDGSGSSLTPKTHPVLSNLTIVGTVDGIVAGGGVVSGGTHYLKDGAHFRRNCGFTLKNSIIYGFPYAIELQNASTEYTFGYNVINGVTSTYTGTTPTGTSITVASSVAAIGLTTPWGGYKSTTALKPVRIPAISNVNFDGLDSSFFDTTVTYKGAFSGSENIWTSASWVL